MVTVRFTDFCLHHVLAHTLLFATLQWPFEKTVVPPTTPSAYAWTHVGWYYCIIHDIGLGVLSYDFME